MLVDMERSYITAGFFRATMYNRYEKLRMQQDMQQQMASQQGDGGQARGMAAKAKSYFPAFGAAKEPEPVQGAGGAMPHHRAATSPTPPPARGGDDSGDEQSGGAAFKMGGDPNDFVAHYFEKCSSNDTALPSSWKWQRRFFIFSDSQRMLYYFKSPEDVPKPNGLRGQVNIAECVIDDLDDRGVPRHPGSPPPSSSDKAHWMIKIRHKDPSRSAVKEHNAIILRAETFASKAEWLGRLRRAIGKPAAETKPTPRRQSGGGGQEGGEHGENGVEQGEGGVPPDGMGRQQSSVNYGEAEPTLDTQLGQGASVFRAEHLRDAAGHLPLAPRVLLNPMRNADKGVVDKVTDTMKAMMTGSFESQYDALLEQFASDMCVYTRMVCDTVVTTVPKAIVHALIKKSQKSLIERLFTVIHKLTPDQMERLLREDDGTVQHRMQARGVFDDVKSAVFAVHQQLERISLGSDRPEKVKLTVNAIAYAGMPALLSTEQKNYYDRLFSHSHAPDCMRFWANPPPMKSVLPGMLPPGVASRRESDSGGADAGRARGPPHGPPGHQPGRGPSAVAPQRPAPGGAPPPVPMRPAPVPGAASVRRAPPPPPPPGGR
ncbi:hypothetical protein FOA52_001752 [Chlamydomonas sp. UWO 241]|nr:hypothetical protein FOA52_001752 [Chlamydomonas sp. UWO 241]